MVEPTPNLYDSPQEAAARALLASLYPDYNARWNVEVSKEEITFCTGYHEKHEECEHNVIKLKRNTAAIYRHKKRGSLYQDLGNGTLQLEEGASLTDGDELKVYIDSMSRLWFRKPSEFHDGRFEKIKESQEVKTTPNSFGSVGPLPNVEPSESTIALMELVKETMEKFHALPKSEQEKMMQGQRAMWEKGPWGPTDGMGTVYSPTPSKFISED